MKCLNCRQIIKQGPCGCRYEYEQKMQRAKDVLMSIPADTYSERQVLSIIQDCFSTGIYFDENGKIRGNLRHLGEDFNK